MRPLFFFILILNAIILNAQINNLVEYNFVQKDGFNEILKEYLVFNEYDLYYANIKNKENVNFEELNLAEIGFNLEPIYINLKTDSIYQSKLGIDTNKSSEYKRFVVGEVIPKLNWKITKESQKILNYTCYKATTTFRGRNYSAWFTPEIPFNYGPWKLHGLPGLILKAETDSFEFEAKRIALNSKNISTIDNLKKMENAKVKYTFPEAFEFENNFIKLLRSQYTSSLPKGEKIIEAPLRESTRELSID